MTPGSLSRTGTDSSGRGGRRSPSPAGSPGARDRREAARARRESPPPGAGDGRAAPGSLGCRQGDACGEGAARAARVRTGRHRKARSERRGHGHRGRLGCVEKQKDVCSRLAGRSEREDPLMGRGCYGSRGVFWGSSPRLHRVFAHKARDLSVTH